MDLKWICISFVFFYVFIYMFKNKNVCITMINFYIKSQSYNKLYDDEVEMDDGPCDIVWWTKPMLESTMERSLPTLPDEVIIEILVRLPVRSLLQFRSVCKSWKTLISSRQFAKDHIQRSITDETLSQQRLVTSNIHGSFHCEFVSLPMQSLLKHTCTATKAVYLKMWCRFEILGSINGLVCLYDYNHSYFRLWNPSTRLRSKGSPTMNYDPRYYIKLYGFGYDNEHDKYKAYVGAGGFNDGHVTKVYTFGANSWTTIQDGSRHWPNTQMPVLGKFVRGTLNWLNWREYVIVSFDLGKETHSEILLPNRYDRNYCFFPELGVIRDCLSVCFKEMELSHSVVWLMKEYGIQHSWTKLAIIPHEELQLSTLNLFTPLCIWEHGHVLGIINKDSRRFVLYNFYNQLEFLFTGCRARPYKSVHIHYESLVSP